MFSFGSTHGSCSVFWRSIARFYGLWRRRWISYRVTSTPTWDTCFPPCRCYRPSCGHPCRHGCLSSTPFWQASLVASPMCCTRPSWWQLRFSCPSSARAARMTWLCWRRVCIKGTRHKQNSLSGNTLFNYMLTYSSQKKSQQSTNSTIQHYMLHRSLASNMHRKVNRLRKCWVGLFTRNPATIDDSTTCFWRHCSCQCFAKFVLPITAGMPYCAAFGCNATSSGPKGAKHHWFRFPSEPRSLKAWLANMKRANFAPMPHSRLCGAHFKHTCFQWNPLLLETLGHAHTRQSLLPDAVPTLFSGVELALLASAPRPKAVGRPRKSTTSTKMTAKPKATVKAKAKAAVRLGATATTATAPASSSSHSSACSATDVEVFTLAAYRKTRRTEVRTPHSIPWPWPCQP